MNYAEFQERFEQDAEEESKRFDAMTVSQIIAEISAARFGETYQIWYALARRAKPAEVNSMLLAFLESPGDYLLRYHCAAALIRVNELAQWQPQELSAAPTYPVAENLRAVRAQLGAA